MAWLLETRVFVAAVGPSRVGTIRRAGGHDYLGCSLIGGYYLDGGVMDCRLFNLTLITLLGITLTSNRACIRQVSSVYLPIVSSPIQR
jgi:hypothetical protein